MERSEIISGMSLGFKFAFLGILLSAILSLFVLLIPNVYDLTFGQNNVDNFIENISVNTTNPDEVSVYLLDWINKNVHYPTKEETILNSFIYKIENKIRFWTRSNHASWLLFTKLGRCGEDAHFYVEIMNALNHSAKLIKPKNWDHAWAEYYSNGYWIALDPSANRIITDRVEHAKNKNATKITGKYPNGTSEDLSGLYGIIKS